MNCGGNAAEKILRNCQAEKMIVQSFFLLHDIGQLNNGQEK